MLVEATLFKYKHPVGGSEKTATMASNFSVEQLVRYINQPRVGEIAVLEIGRRISGFVFVFFHFLLSLSTLSPINISFLFMIFLFPFYLSFFVILSIPNVSFVFFFFSLL